MVNCWKGENKEKGAGSGAFTIKSRRIRSSKRINWSKYQWNNVTGLYVFIVTCHVFGCRSLQFLFLFPLFRFIIFVQHKMMRVLKRVSRFTNKQTNSL